MADSGLTPEEIEALKKRRAFKKFSYRGVDVRTVWGWGRVV